MGRKIFILYFTIYLLLEGVASKPIEDASVIEGINFQYENDKWICGNVECPANTFGCKILLRTKLEDRKALHHTYNCIDKDKTVTQGSTEKMELSQAKIIDIDLETYNGAESVYSLAYGLGGHENAKGVIAVDGLDGLKERAKRNKKNVDLNILRNQ